MKVTINHNNRIFEAYIGGCGCDIVEVSFYEVVRPSWKIFRTTILPFYSSWFFLEDFESIMAGIEKCLTEGIAKESKEKISQNKWKDFENTIDKTIKM